MAGIKRAMTQPPSVAKLQARVAHLEEKLKALEKELASAPPTPRIRRMERILEGSE